jgi:hypothetical protein
MKKSLFIFLAITIVFGNLLPFVANAQNNQTVPKLFPDGYWGTNPPLLPCKGAEGEMCKDVCELVALTRNVIYIMMSFVVFILSPILFLWGGILILIAGANPSLLEQGKKVLTGTLIGILIAIAAFLIVKTFINFLGVKAGYIGGFDGSNAINCQVAPPASN